MKRVFSMTFILLVGIFLFVRCSQDTNPEYIEQPTCDSALLQELTKINNELFDEHPQTKITTKEFLAVATHDVLGAWAGGKFGFKVGTKVGTMLGNPIYGGGVGAFIGAVGYGAYRSWLVCPENEGTVISNQDLFFLLAKQMAKCELSPEDAVSDEIIDKSIFAVVEYNPDIIFEEEEKIVIDKNLLDNVELSKPAILVGQMHNVLLSECNKAEKIHKTKSVVSVPPCNLENPYVKAILDSDEMMALLNGNDESGQDFSLPSAVLNKFASIYNSYPENDLDVIKIINLYSVVIQASDELSADEKECISYGLATALYSYNYWSKTYERK